VAREIFRVETSRWVKNAVLNGTPCVRNEIARAVFRKAKDSVTIYIPRQAVLLSRGITKMKKTRNSIEHAQDKPKNQNRPPRRDTGSSDRIAGSAR